VERGVTARLGLLHTVPALADAFDRMLADALPESERVHVVDAWMLRAAIDEGVTPAVRERVARHLGDLAAGADAVLVTCSSIGEAVEEAAARLDVPALRVDAAMAEEAVRRAAAAASAGDPAGRPDSRPPARIAVLATNTATLGPTGRLLEREAERQGVRAEVSSEVVAGAAAARASGNAAEHDRLVADAVRSSAAADVIVLAQASMADAAALAGVDVPVLTSPAGGVAALVSAVRGERADGDAGGDA
jgi:hypothetical protein